MMNSIIIKGARVNNLKNIDLTIPRNKIVCFVGVSGSGKSTIAFDIIAREGQRQFFESLSTYARRYLAKSNRPDVTEIKGISATVVIDQERVSGNPRSTVGTLTETYTYLRMLYSRCGWPVFDSSYFSYNHPLGACKKCKGLGRAVEVSVDRLLDREKSLNEGAIRASVWYAGGRQWTIIKSTGYFDLDKKVKDYSSEELDKLLYAPPEMLETKGDVLIMNRWMYRGIVRRIMEANSKVSREPSRSMRKYFDFVPCFECAGQRIGQKGRSVLLNGISIGELANRPIDECLAWAEKFDHPNAVAIKPRLVAQLQNLVTSGVGYLSLNRSADTLSGGEAQRVKMARQMGCDLVETIYVLDEPTAGLHMRDVGRVVANLRRLRDAGNTVIVVEHDEEVIRSADWLVEVGPGGGSKGGEIVASGPTEVVLADGKSVTGRWMGEGTSIKNKEVRIKHGETDGFLKIEKATRNNLKNINVDIPLGQLVALTGVSGSGKSSLVEEIMTQYGEKIVLVDQRPVGDNRRGCLVTYVGAFDEIRNIYAKATGQSVSMFSFNGQGGCPACRGLGAINMDMNFLGSVLIKCESCEGKKYRPEVLKWSYRGKSILDVIKMTAGEAGEFFDSRDIKDKMEMLSDVGLDYLELGQSLDTLSGGEAQRLKLASRLQKQGEIYILDEPTSGLHMADIDRLINLLTQLVEAGNTVIVVEHNPKLILACDYIIDLGPEGGEAGGEIVALGSPEEVMRNEASWTGKYLLRYLDKRA